VKIVVDPDRCELNMRCVSAAAAVFEVTDQDDYARVKLPEVPAELKDAVERAIRLCPRQAIAWAED
jgi:ferredoxin